MTKNTVFLVLVALIVIHGLISTSSVDGKPVAQAGDGASDLIDLETSANTIIFRPMFVYHLQQRRLKAKLEKLRAQRLQQQQQQRPNQV